MKFSFENQPKISENENMRKPDVLERVRQMKNNLLLGTFISLLSHVGYGQNIDKESFNEACNRERVKLDSVAEFHKKSALDTDFLEGEYLFGKFRIDATKYFNSLAIGYFKNHEDSVYHYLNKENIGKQTFLHVGENYFNDDIFPGFFNKVANCYQGELKYPTLCDEQEKQEREFGEKWSRSLQIVLQYMANASENVRLEKRQKITKENLDKLVILHVKKYLDAEKTKECLPQSVEEFRDDIKNNVFPGFTSPGAINFYTKLHKYFYPEAEIDNEVARKAISDILDSTKFIIRSRVPVDTFDRLAMVDGYYMSDTDGGYGELTVQLPLATHKDASFRATSIHEYAHAIFGRLAGDVDDTALEELAGKLDGKTLEKLAEEYGAFWQIPLLKECDTPEKKEQMFADYLSFDELLARFVSCVVPLVRNICEYGPNSDFKPMTQDQFNKMLDLAERANFKNGDTRSLKTFSDFTNDNPANAIEALYGLGILSDNREAGLELLNLFLEGDFKGYLELRKEISSSK